MRYDRVRHTLRRIDIAIPKVSVIIPAYNAEPWLQDTLESIFDQTFEDYEVVFINDGSTDGTERIAKAFGERVRYFYQPNRGAAAARNAGVLNSRGELVAQLDADDLWLPNMLSELVPMFDDPSVGVACGDAYYWDQQKLIEECSSHWQTRPRLTGDDVWLQLVRIPPLIPPQATIARRSALVGVGLYDESLSRAEDYDMWLRIARAGYRFRFVDRVLGVYRLRPGSLSRDTRTGWSMRARVYMKWLSRDDLSGEERRIVKSRLRRQKLGLAVARKSPRFAARLPRILQTFRKIFPTLGHPE